MWAKVITLADITTGDGKHLTQECKEANSTSNCHHSLTWPKAGQPDQTCWKLWTKAIDECFLRADDRHERLSRPLGAWTLSSQKIGNGTIPSKMTRCTSTNSQEIGQNGKEIKGTGQQGIKASDARIQSYKSCQIMHYPRQQKDDTYNNLLAQPHHSQPQTILKNNDGSRSSTHQRAFNRSSKESPKEPQCG
jgi:hypothetical protein